MLFHSSKKKVYIDDKLMEAICQGNQDAFKELYEKSYRPLYAFLLSLTQNSEDARDLMQETYIKVSQSCYQYQKGNPMAWIMKIGKNQFLMKIRKEKLYEIEDLEQIPADNQIDLSGMASVENKIFLEQLFERITKEEQMIVTLHVIAGLKHREIGKLLGKPTGTILAKYNRALRKLREENR